METLSESFVKIQTILIKEIERLNIKLSVLYNKDNESDTLIKLRALCEGKLLAYKHILEELFDDDLLEILSKIEKR